MQLRNIVAFYLLLLPIAAQADETQKNNISIKTTVCQPNEPVIEYKGNYHIHIKGDAFIAKSLNPIWVEITNNSDQFIEISAQSVPEKIAILKKFKNGWGAWIALSCLTIAPYADLGYLYFYLEAKLKRKDLNNYWHWDPFRQDFSSRLLLAGMAFGAWCSVYFYNKTLESVFNDLMLQDQLVVEPGETVKKLIILGTEKKFVLNVVDMSTQQSVQQFEYECGIAE